MVSIGGAKIETPLALGPMAGVTDAAFRTICREQGAGLTCTEMVSAKALCYQDKKSVPLLARAGHFKEQIVRITTLADVYRITEEIRRQLC